MDIRRVIELYCQNGKVKKVVFDIDRAKMVYSKIVEHNDQKSLCDGVRQKTVKELFDYFVFNNQNGIDYQLIDAETGEVQDVYESMDDCIEDMQNAEVFAGDRETIQGESKKGNVDVEKRVDTGTTDDNSDVKEKITERTNE